MDASLMHNLLKAVFLYGQRYCWGSLTDAPLLRFVFLSVFFFSHRLSSPCTCERACVRSWELWGMGVELLWGKNGWMNSSAGFSPWK